MEERFTRNIGAITENELQKLNAAKVFVAGCGGLGGYVIEYLIRVGIGHIVCADSGRFETSDLNRQIFSDTKAIGRKKVDVVKERAQRICPDINIDAIDVNMDRNNLSDLISGCDLAIDALDSKITRAALFSACRAQGIPTVHGAVEGWQAQAAFIPPNIEAEHLLYPGTDYSPQSDQISVLSFTPGMAA